MTSLSKPAEAPGAIRSLIPARIDRLPWSPFHTRMVAALGTAWILDGLEITVAGAVVDRLTEPETLGLSGTEVGLIATVYLLGEVVGALWFGRLSDKLGRRKLFMITLAVYLVGSGLTALTLGNGPGWVAFLYVTRFIAGMGIGGEYAAIHSAIDELIPAKYRGRVDIMVSGTYWAGAVLGTLGTFILLNALEPSTGWRIAFLIGPVLGLVILLVRRHLPESPRWQVMHGREAEAEETIAYIEHEVEHGGRSLPAVDESRAIELKPTPDIGYAALTRVLFREYPARAVYGATLMVTQSFLYNAIFFTYVLVLGTYYDVDSGDAPLFLIAFAVGNLAGPFVLGHLFDTVGRKKMIAGTYVLSGILLAVTAGLFQAGALNAYTQTIAWSVIFFFASAGASSAYLTVSEIFPMEVRAKAIAVFFAIAQCFGALGPVVYGSLIGDGSQPIRLFWGYMLGAAVMVVGGVVAAVLGIDAEGKSLEDVATPFAARRPATRAEGAARPRG
ncbi:MFS transporter [Geodermatophilus nigrescens]